MDIFQNDECNNIKQSFQDGCNTLVSKCTELGVTPSSNSPTDIANAIQTIANNQWSAGNTNGWSAGHTAGYNEGYEAGRTNPIIQHVDISANPSANSYNMNWNLSKHISKYASLVLYQNLFPFMVSALDMSNWNTSMRRSCILYNWGYNATNGILTIRSAYTDGGMVQYGSGIVSRTVRVYYC